MSAFFLFLASVAAPALQVQNGHFVDAAGRHVVLHGVNVGQKHAPYVSDHTEEDYARMRAWGFNCVRFLILWAAVEPEPGQYDEDYLRRVDERMAWAARHNLHVVLDMHQDLYGEAMPGGDGAPKWATIDDNLPHFMPGGAWSVAYQTSPKVQAAFDNFYANRPLPDGTPIQERFAAAWRHVAQHFADTPAVVGYDLLNEPHPGSRVRQLPHRVLPRLMEAAIGKQGAPTPGWELVERLRQPDAVLQILGTLNDDKLWPYVLEAAEPVVQRFEREELQPLYQRVADAIRAVDRNRILFFEPSVTSNIGLVSAIQPLAGPDGAVDPQQALAPHAYDIVLDTPYAPHIGDKRMDLIFSRYRQLQQACRLPVLIGEWGGFYGSRHAMPAARLYAEQFARTGFGDTYWDYGSKLEDTAFFAALSRPYPAAVCGEVVRCAYDFDARAFECVWQENGTSAPSLFCVPPAWYPDGYSLTLEPPGPTSVPEPHFVAVSPVCAGPRSIRIVAAGS